MSLPPRAYPRVIIVGGGLGGLMLAILLDKMGVPYHIFERAPKVKPLGKLPIQPSTDISNFTRLRNRNLAGQVSFRPHHSCSHSCLFLFSSSRKFY